MDGLIQCTEFPTSNHQTQGISHASVKLSYAELTERASRVVQALGLPEGARVEGLFATHDNVFSKPRPGFWYLLEDKCVVCISWCGVVGRRMCVKDARIATGMTTWFPSRPFLLRLRTHKLHHP